MRFRVPIFAVPLLVLLALVAPEPAVGSPVASWTTTVGQGGATVAVHGTATFVASTGWFQGGAGRWWARSQLTRLSGSGATVWTRSWRPPGAHAEPTSVAVAEDGSVYVAGDLRPSEGMCSGWFLRAYGPDGSPRWHREQPGARTCRTASSAAAVAATDDLVVLATGDSVDGWGTTDGWIRAYGPAGRPRWVHAFGAPGYGPDPYTFAADVALGVHESVYVAGGVTARPSTAGGDVDQDAVVQRLTPTGQVRWTRTFDDGTPQGSDYDRLTSVDVRGDVLVVAGMSQREGANARDTWVSRLGFDGRSLWTVHVAYDKEALTRVSRAGSVIVTWSGGAKGVQVQALGAAGHPRWRVALTAAEGSVRVTGLSVGSMGIAVGGVHPAGREHRTVARVWYLDA